MKRSMRRYATAIAGAVNVHGPVAGVLAVAGELVEKASKSQDPESARRLAADAAGILKWLQEQVSKMEAR
jgi:hypothetical protein